MYFRKKERHRTALNRAGGLEHARLRSAEPPELEIGASVFPRVTALWVGYYVALVMGTMTIDE